MASIDRSALLRLLVSLALCLPGIAAADTRVVDCSVAGASIQAAIDKRPIGPMTIVIRGTCTQDVLITKDDVTLMGEGGTVTGAIDIRGAKRIVIRRLTITGSPAFGVRGTETAAFTVEDSVVQSNSADGILVERGAHARISGNTIAHNGQGAVLDRGRGVHVVHGASADVIRNSITDNRSDGIGVFNNGYAQVVENQVLRNGRLEAGECGIQVVRARVRANGNVIRNNNFAAIGVYNNGDYRTGTGLNSADFPDNAFAFEQIEGVGPGRVAVDLNSSAFADLRQVELRGAINVGAHSFLQVRGDNIAPSLQCSTIDTTGGGVFISALFGAVRLRAVHITPPLPAAPNVEVSSPCL
jgi:hypothetical protein